MRIISRLDIKNNFVIKGINLEGVRKVGDPIELAKKYYQQGVDEVLLMDAVASLYGRNNLFHILERACEEVFVPITIGGGLKTIGDIEKALMAGADKVAINTQAVKSPEFVTEAASRYGAQCIVASVEAKQKGEHWEAYTENGREETGLNVIEWCKELEDRGAGEILITSVDHEGMKKGMDIALTRAVNDVVTIPVIASGGVGREDHVLQCYKDTGASAVAIAGLFHYNQLSVSQLRDNVSVKGVSISRK